MEQDDKQADLFRRMIERLWGYGAQTRAARYFEVSDRTVRHWIAGRHPIPPRVMAELRAIISIAPPPDSDAGEDRDDSAREALEPALTELRDRAVAAGWLPAEVAAAILALTVDEIRAHAGDEQAMRVLIDAVGQIAAVDPAIGTPPRI
jgi:hypothetical protein